MSKRWALRVGMDCGAEPSQPRYRLRHVKPGVAPLSPGIYPNSRKGSRTFSFCYEPCCGVPDYFFDDRMGLGQQQGIAIHRRQQCKGHLAGFRLAAYSATSDHHRKTTFQYGQYHPVRPLFINHITWLHRLECTEGVPCGNNKFGRVFRKIIFPSPGSIPVQTKGSLIMACA